MPQKVSSSSFVGRMGCSCNTGGARGGWAGVQLLPSRGENPLSTSWGRLRKEEGAGPRSCDTAADRKQICQMRGSEHQAAHQGVPVQIVTQVKKKKKKIWEPWRWWSWCWLCGDLERFCAVLKESWRGFCSFGKCNTLLRLLIYHQLSWKNNGWINWDFLFLNLFNPRCLINLFPNRQAYILQIKMGCLGASKWIRMENPLYYILKAILQILQIIHQSSTHSSATGQKWYSWRI